MIFHQSQRFQPSECVDCVQVMIWNDSETDVTDYSVRVLLSAVNFDFTLVADPDDLQFIDGSSTLKHWKEIWDPANDFAQIWVKIPALTKRSHKIIDLTWNPALPQVPDDPDNVFLYFNALETQADINALTKSGGASYALDDTLSSPLISGNCLSVTETGAFNYAYESVAGFPAIYEAQVWQRNLGNFTSGREYFSALAWHVSSGDRCNNFAHDMSPKQNDVRAETNACDIYTGPSTVDRMKFEGWVACSPNRYNWFKQTTQYCYEGIFQYGTQFATPELTGASYQGITLEPGRDLLYIQYGTQIRVYTPDGVATGDFINNIYGGTSWGGSTFYGGEYYALWWGDPGVKIYKFDPDDIAAGGTLVVDLSSNYSPPLGANGLKYDGRNWLLGISAYADDVMRHGFDVYDESWQRIKTIYTPMPAHESYGIQGIQERNGNLVLVYHEGLILVCGWDNASLHLTPRSTYYSAVEEPHGAQDIVWDEARSVWHFPSRQDEVIKRVTLTSGATRMVNGFVEDYDYPAAIVRQPVTEKITNAAGISFYRSISTCGLFYREIVDWDLYATLEPLVSPATTAYVDLDGDGIADNVIRYTADMVITENGNSVNVDLDGDGIADIVLPK